MCCLLMLFRLLKYVVMFVGFVAWWRGWHVVVDVGS